MAGDVGDRDTTFVVEPIGVIRVHDADDDETPIQTRMAPTRRATIALDPALGAALDGLGEFDFAWVVTLLDRADDPRDAGADALRPVPFLLAEQGTRVGVFASRFPHRPNRLGLSLVRIERVEATELHFSGVDMLDGTPVLDIKPWVSDFDLPPGASAPPEVRCGWYDTLETRPLTLDDPQRSSGTPPSSC